MTDPKIGDRVRFNPVVLSAHRPEVRGRVGTITKVEGPYPGQGDRLFVSLRLDGDDADMTGISSHMLLRE